MNRKADPVGMLMVCLFLYRLELKGRPEMPPLGCGAKLEGATAWIAVWLSSLAMRRGKTFLATGLNFSFGALFFLVFFSRFLRKSLSSFVSFETVLLDGGQLSYCDG